MSDEIYNKSVFDIVLMNRWMKTAILFFFLTSLLGLLMRYFYIAEVPFLEYKHLLHAHSHVALLGWGYMFVSGAMLFLFISSPGSQKVYRFLFILNTISATGMAIFFLYQGYGAYSITFSTVHLISVYIFSYYFLKDLRALKSELHSPFIRWSVYWLLVSTAGLWAIAPVSIFLGKLHPVYFMSIQFFLHFQFNGWFTYAIIGLLIFHISGNSRQIKVPRSGFWLLQLSLPLTYALSVTWSTPVSYIFYLNTAGVILQALAFYLIFRPVWDASKPLSRLSGWTDWLLLVGITCLAVKAIIQITVALPAVATISYTIRNYVIGFIHLVMLGSVSLTGAAILLKQRLLSANHIAKWGWILLAIAFVGTELLLFGQGTLLWMRAGFMPFYYESLFGLTILFPIAILTIVIGLGQPRFQDTS